MRNEKDTVKAMQPGYTRVPLTRHYIILILLLMDIFLTLHSARLQQQQQKNV